MEKKMKLITAIIPADRLDPVREALIRAEISRITVTRVTGHGQQQDMDLYRGQKVVPNLVPKVRIDIATTNEFVELIVDTIIKTARHGDGKIGDGKIFITNLEECIRIRTGDKGEQAI
jgi:nitrogen regulatory protein P-II 1